MTTPQKLRCQVKSVISHGDQVYTIELLPDVPPVPRFKAGQFFHLALDPYDPSGFWPESRVFSIASSPRERERIQFTYSVRGRYTARMEKEVATGREVWVKMPYGEFFLDISHPVVLFAGGTGITAFTAFLHDLIDRPPCPVTVFYGARHRDLLIYRSLVDRCVQCLNGFRAFYCLESLERGAPNELPGQISIAAAWDRIQDPAGSSFYISGPPAMLKNLSSQLRNRGVKEQDIHIDAWE
ncbi:MAG: FAD-dependent oxidoreductase [Dehalococcoidia bacterium]|nr:FAD-dependent oxidoreductase [Dehalococcoidia bacterium]